MKVSLQRFLVFTYVAGIFVSSLAISAVAMEFDTGHNGGNCTGCEWVVASGPIEKGDAEKFEAFVRSQNIEPFRVHNIVYFDSPGGSLAEGMALGRKIRELGFSTGIGRVDPDEEEIPGARNTLSDGNCISACAYAFLGGKYRYIDEENGSTKKSCLGFHQFFDPNAIDRSTASALDAQQTTQLISGIVVEYLIEIAADVRIYTFASRYRGSEYGCIDTEMAVELDIDNSKDRFSEWKLVPFGKGAIAEVDSLRDGRKVRFYCKGNEQFATFFFPGSVADERIELHRTSGNALHLGGENSVTRVKFITAEAAKDGSRTAVVFKVDRKVITTAAEKGKLLAGLDSEPRVLLGYLNSYVFDFPEDSRAVYLALSNCI